MNQFKDKRFSFTGRLESMTVKHAEDTITSNGGKVVSVLKNVDYLVVGKAAGSKLAVAKAKKVNMISEHQFLQLIHETTQHKEKQ